MAIVLMILKFPGPGDRTSPPGDRLTWGKRSCLIQTECQEIPSSS